MSNKPLEIIEIFCSDTSKERREQLGRQIALYLQTISHTEREDL